MQFSMDTTPASLPALLSQFFSIVGFDKLKPRLNQIEKRSKDSGWRDYAEDRLGLESALVNVISYKKSTNRVPWPPPTADYYRLYSFMFAVVGVHSRLSQKAKERLAGALNGCLDQEDGFGSLAFEMRVATSLMQSGFDVSFPDLEGQERFDFLACKDEHVIEVECKFVSPDIGRKIHQRKFHQLAEYLKPTLDKAMGELKGGTFVKIELADRLATDIKELAPIKEAIEKLLKTGEETHSTSFSAKRQEFSIPDSPLRSGKTPTLLEDLKKFVEEKLGVTNPHILLRAELKNGPAIILSVNSKQADKVLEGIYTKHLREASGQLTGKRVGIACLHFADLDENQLHNVAGARTGLTDTVNSILKKRPKLYGVALMTNGTVRETRSKLLYAPTITSETGPVYTFRNPFSPPDESTKNIYEKIFNS